MAIRSFLARSFNVRSLKALYRGKGVHPDITTNQIDLSCMPCCAGPSGNCPFCTQFPSSVIIHLPDNVSSTGVGFTGTFTLPAVDSTWLDALYAAYPGTCDTWDLNSQLGCLFGTTTGLPTSASFMVAWMVAGGGMDVLVNWEDEQYAWFSLGYTFEVDCTVENPCDCKGVICDDLWDYYFVGAPIGAPPANFANLTLDHVSTSCPLTKMAKQSTTGSHLHAIFRDWFHQDYSPGCGCQDLAQRMDSNPPEWTEQNMGMIVNRIRAEILKRGWWGKLVANIPGVQAPVWALVRIAVKRAKEDRERGTG